MPGHTGRPDRERAAGAVPWHQMTMEQRLAEAIRRSLPHMPGTLATEVAQLFTPEAMALMTGVVAAWAASHFFGVGQIADVILLVAGVLAWGGSAMVIGMDVMKFVAKVKDTKSEADLDEAGKVFAGVVVRIGSTAVSAMFFKAKPKIYGGPPRAVLPAPRFSGLSYKPTIKSAPLRSNRPGAILDGVTDPYGNITINLKHLNDPDPTRFLLTLYHEQVHQFLTPKFFLFRDIRIRINQGGYHRSYVLRYLEEALAEGYAQFRVHGFQQAIQAISFPTKNDYVTVALMGVEVRGHMMGTINVAGMSYQVLLTDGPEAVIGMKE